MSEDVNVDFDSSPILHIIVVGFHHQKGAQVQFTYPEFKSDNLEKGLPVHWNCLLHLALPDGAHNHDEDFIFFKLPSLVKDCSTASKNVYGVACFQQIESKILKVREDDVTRGTVQKSVIIISKLPLFGFILSKLSMITHAYFDQKDFSQTDILKDTYIGLSHSLSNVKLNDPTLHVGLSLKGLVKDFKEKVLILFKLILLERKVVFWGAPVGKVCNAILSLLSLYPGFLQHSMLEGSSHLHKSIDQNNRLLKDQYGLPLDMFEKNYAFHPYLSLQQMDLLKSDQLNAFVVGASNVLFKNKSHCSWDALIDLETNQIQIDDVSLSSQLSLTTEDLRFTEYLSSTVAEHETDSSIGWDGSEDWIRIQFKYYLLCLLASTAPEIGLSSHIYRQFNENFIAVWKHTDHFKNWCSTKHMEIENINQGHPFEGGLTVADLQLKLKNRLSTIGLSNESQKKLHAAVQKTGQIAGNAYNSAKTVFSSWKGWFTGVIEELNDEMQVNAINIETVNSNNESITELSEELDRGMMIPKQQRTGKS